jgi:hypothetical protein
MKRRRIYLYAGLPLAVLFVGFGAWFVYAELTSRSGLNFNHDFHVKAGADCDLCHQVDSQDPRFVSFPDHDNCSVCHEEAVAGTSKDKNCELCHTNPDYATRVRKGQVLSPLVRFDHALHAAQKVGCDACHPTPDEPFLSNDEMLPKMEACIACHQSRRVADVKDCSTCHPGGWQKVAPPSHAASWVSLHPRDLNKKLIDSDCRVCHTAQLGNSCTACHHQKGPKAAKTEDCAICHGKGFQDRRPKDHGPQWTLTHGRNLSQARIEANCALCHTQRSGNDCLSCHRREAPQSHNLAWTIKSHGQTARRDRERCSVCHDQSECVACHTTNPPSSHTGLWGSPRDRHCINCHMERDNYASGGVGSNCSFCHRSAEVYAAHTSLPRPTTAGTPPQPHPYLDSCTNCHHVGGSGGPIPHPYPTTTTQCRSCHY